VSDEQQAGRSAGARAAGQRINEYISPSRIGRHDDLMGIGRTIG